MRSRRVSLRAKVALGIGLPILLAFSSLSYIRYVRQKDLIRIHAEQETQQLGSITLNSLRHAMLLNNRCMIAYILSDVGVSQEIDNLYLVGPDGTVKASSDLARSGDKECVDESGCVECHSLPSEGRPTTTRMTGDSDLTRISVPIINDPHCQGCHTDQGAVLGMLLADVTLLESNQDLLRGFETELVITLVAALLIALFAYFLVHRLVVRRVELLAIPLGRLSEGDFSARIPVPERPSDELTELALAFNHMAQYAEDYTQSQKELSHVRESSIVEERDRISRELHDGLAQILGYLNTKLMAIRLMLQNRQFKSAQSHLAQLEGAARELFVDVREAILGLRLTGGQSDGFADTLREFATQFSHLCDIAVKVNIDPEAEGIPFEPMIELHLLRIVQEALANVRKHACVTRAWVNVSQSNGTLVLNIIDNGKGFEPQAKHDKQGPQFGLKTMRERAEAIGASFNLTSSPGDGTSITVSLQLPEASTDACAGS